MTNIEMIGGKPYSGENNKDTYIVTNTADNPAKYTPCTQPIFTDDYILRGVVTATTGGNGYIQVIDRKTLTTVRYLRISTSGSIVDAWSMTEANGNLVIFAKTTTVNSFYVAKCVVADIILEALTSDNDDMYILSPYSIVTVIGTGIVIPSSKETSNWLGYDGNDTVYIASSTSVYKYIISTNSVEWSKTGTDIIGGTSSYITSALYLSDRVLLTIQSGTSPYNLTIATLRHLDGRMLTQRTIVGAGVYSTYQSDLGVMGEIGTSDIIIKTANLLTRVNKTTLRSVWSRRLPYNATDASFRINEPYDEGLLVTYAAVSNFDKFRSVKINLTTGKDKKVIVEPVNTLIKTLWRLEGDEIYGGSSSSVLTLLQEIEK